MVAPNIKLCKDSDSERQAGDATLNAKLEKMKALNSVIEKLTSLNVKLKRTTLNVITEKR